MEEDIYSGLTLDGAILATTSVLSTISHAKLHIGPAFDGTLEASQFTTRVAATYGLPDANGLADLTGAFTFENVTHIEDTWGVSFGTAPTAGVCRMGRGYEEMKYVFVNDNLTVVSAPFQIPAVGI